MREWLPVYIRVYYKFARIYTIKILIWNMSGLFVLKNVATGRVLDSDHRGSLYTLPYNHGKYE